jgi:RNA recognition motif-containing protein
VFGDATNVKRIYVGNLSWSATEDQLREFFGSYGDVHSVAIITDRETGRSRGFGFVEMDDDGARQAISAGNGQALDGRPLRVSEANERPQRRRYA